MQNIVVFHVEYAVIAIEVGRNEHYFNLVFRTVCKSKSLELVKNRVVFGIVETVSEVFVLDVCVFAVECSKKALLRTVVVARNENVRKYFAVDIWIVVKLVECIHENVVTLVGVFVASRCCDNQRIFLEFA